MMDGVSKKKGKAKKLIEDLRNAWNSSERKHFKNNNNINQKPLIKKVFANKSKPKPKPENLKSQPELPFKQPKDRFPKPPSPDFYLGQGLNFYNKGEFKKAINCFQIVIDVEPQNNECKTYLSKAKLKLKDFLKQHEASDKDFNLNKSITDELMYISDAPIVTNKIPENLIEFISENDPENKNKYIDSFNFKDKLELFSHAIDQSSEGISLFSLQGDLIFANDAFANMHGYEQDKIIGMQVINFQSNNTNQTTESMDTQAQDTYEFHGEEWHMRNDGSVFPTITHKSLLRDEDGNQIGILGTHRDITKLKESEEQIRKLSSAVKQSIDGIAIIDLKSKISFSNEAFAKTHGYSIEFLMGMKIDELYSNNQKNISKKIMKRVEKDGSWMGEIKCIKKDSSVFPSFVSATLLTNIFSEPTGILIISRDITEQKLMEKELEHYTKHLEDEVKKRTIELIQAEKLGSLGQLVAGIAHEINNPLGYLNSNTELIEEDIEVIKKSTKDKKILQLVETIGELTKTNFKGIDKIIKTTRSLERFALPYKGEKNLTNINQCIKDTLFILSNQMKDRVELHEDYGFTPEIMCNKVHLNQVFINILLNAIEATDNGNIWVKTWVENSKFNIEIKDDGMGISENIIDKVFDPFFSTKKMGKGMGLSLCYRIIHDYNGTISIKSKVGKGTNVTVKLPIVDDND